MKKLILLCLIIAACSKPETDCYHCHSPIMQDVTFCGYTRDELKAVQAWRLQWLNDTLVCDCDKFDLDID